MSMKPILIFFCKQIRFLHFKIRFNYSLSRMTCPICFKLCEHPDTSYINNKLIIPTLVKLLALSSPELEWKSKSMTLSKQWSFCGMEECHTMIIHFLKLVQEYHDLKQELGRSLHKILANLAKDCEIDLESWSRNQLEQQCSWDVKKGNDIRDDLLCAINFNVEEVKGQPNLEPGWSETQLNDQNQDEQVVAITENDLPTKRNLKSDSLQSTQEEPSIKRKQPKISSTRRKGRKHGKTNTNSTQNTAKIVPNSSRTCDKCAKTFLTPTSLRAHKRTHVRDGMNDDGTFHCTHCPSILPSLEELKAHRSQEHEKPRDFCPICRRQLSKGALVQHLHSHQMKQAGMMSPPLPPSSSDMTINCVICQKAFSSPPLLAAHLAVHTGEYSCFVETCRKSFSSSMARRKHEENVHQDQQNCPVMDCVYCYQGVFHSEQEFQIHVKNHEDEVMKKRFLCETCGSYYLTKKSLQQHMRKNHNHPNAQQNGGGEGKCEVCGKSFLNPQRLKVHLLTHNKEHRTNPSRNADLVMFSCPEPSCGKSCGQKVSLQSHLMVHHATEMRYKCPYCDHSGFTYAQGLRSHLFKNHHSQAFSDKSHVCRVCYKNYSTEQELLLHEGNHDKLKCKLCSKQFKSMNHLKEHTLRHADIRPFRCPHCPSKGYVRKQQLNNHLQKVHQQNSTSTTASLDQERITYVIQIP